MRILNLGDGGVTNGVAAVLHNDVDDAVDPHLERIKNAAGGEESDEEVCFMISSYGIFFCFTMYDNSCIYSLKKISIFFLFFISD